MWIFALIAVVAPGANPAASQIQFSARESIVTGGGGSGAVGAGDFNGDGRLDLVTCNTNTDDITVILADEAGGYAPGQVVHAFPANGGPSEGRVATGDFNEDGAIDLVGKHAGRIVILLGDGAGGFQLLTELFRSSVFDLEVSDLDGDGHLDMVVAGRYLELLFGAGDGTFTSRFVHSNTIGFHYFQVACADFDGNGVVDFALVYAASVALLLGSEDGSYFRSIYPVGSTVTDIVAGDFDGDSSIDVAVSRGAAPVVNVLRGDGAGTLGPLETHDNQGKSDAIAAADVDGDGNLDLVTANGPSRTVSVLRGDGLGGFTLALSLPSETRQPETMLLVDLDGNCTEDIVIANNRAPTISRWLQQGGSVLEGTVGLGRGPREDVLLLNGSPGAGPDRRVEYGVLSPFELRIRRPSSVPQGEVAPCAIYAWAGRPRAGSARSLPWDIGCVALPIPLTGGDPQPDVIWNNAARRRLLGTPTHPSDPAPSVLARRANGLRRAVTFFVQGVVYDPASASSKPASVTNGILAVPVFSR